MRVLAIETSCDETGIAIVEGEKTSTGFAFTIVDHALVSQAQLHSEYGGVYPHLAKREHEKNLPILFKKFENEKVDALAITQGPGLEPALWTGIEFAKKLARTRALPLIPVNHMEGHLISSLVQNGRIMDVQLPVLALLVSGGHTQFVLMREWFEYEIVGETLDDAVGEAFDKVGRMLGLPYPGGPEISKNAEEARKRNLSLSIKLPRPMLTFDTCDVSFSGLKTAALYALRDLGVLDEEQKMAFAREFEDAVTDVIVAKTMRALAETGAKTFVLGGGVAANKNIRENLKTMVTNEFSDVNIRLPELSITGDNAIMIAEVALARSLSGLAANQAADIRAVGNLSIAG
ncbi:MAG TPA: tRNA (adenosine(37)-N6)-threonylcarbamoyltransferase complex transferase subunit TsaD [Candidatus Paceibacterota bacterium]|nr:tRNA (adenosine(37)-N6)-threonylcarbamoyltransferase complex transferase subunit TsaD [Candidatus Paceibacterota bacterium]